MPSPHVITVHRPNSAARQEPVTGIVTTQATPIWRTIAQCTCRQRQRPPPTPTTEEATTCVVEVGAPSSDAPKITPAEARLARKALDRLDAVDADGPRYG